MICFACSQVQYIQTVWDESLFGHKYYKQQKEVRLAVSDYVIDTFNLCSFSLISFVLECRMKTILKVLRQPTKIFEVRCV